MTPSLPASPGAPRAASRDPLASRLHPRRAVVPAALAAVAALVAAGGAIAACGPPPLPPAPVVVVPAMASALPSASPEDEAASAPLLCPPHTVYIPGGNAVITKKRSVVRDFCMDVTEVTASAYAACVHRGACSDEQLECDEQWTYNKPGREEHPINCVTWKQADAYCHAAGRRLPTFEEWEWAAQAGSERRRFAWGDSEPDSNLICWSESAPQGHTCQVGSFPASRTAQGIDDMFGNVWEYLSPPQRNGIVNVSRGSSWQNSGVDTLEGDNPGGFNSQFVRNDVVGFRCLYDGGRPQPVARSSKIATPEEPPDDSEPADP